MSWLTSIDLYCERFDPGLFSEPLNAVSNLAFIAAGMGLLSYLPRLFAPLRPPVSLEILSGLVVLIGICSGAFHVFAMKWAELLDVLSIALFIYSFVVCLARYALSFRWGMAWIAAPMFWAFGVLVTAPFDPSSFNGSVGYFPMLAGLALIGIGLAIERSAGARYFGLATSLFLVSLSLRSVDLAWCGNWVWGTHWAWHLLNAAVLTLATLGLAHRALESLQLEKR